MKKLIIIAVLFLSIFFVPASAAFSQDTAQGKMTGEALGAIQSSASVNMDAVFLILGATLLVVLIIGTTIFFLTRAPIYGYGFPKIAVLPFENLGLKRDSGFVDGLSDAIAVRLALIKSIRVISRQSSMQYKKSNKTGTAIGNELKADYILQGIVQRDPEMDFRIIPQLIRTRDDIQVWTTAFNESSMDSFGLQEKIAEKVSEAMGITLVEPTRKLPTENPDAYQYYLQGNSYRVKSLEEENVRIAIKMYEKALEFDPKFSAAYSAISSSRVWLYWKFGAYEELARSKNALNAAIDLDLDSFETQIAMGYYTLWGGLDFDHALKHFEIAHNMRPSNTEVLTAMSFIYRRQANWVKSIEGFENALELDPRNHFIEVNIGRTLNRIREYAKAEKHFEMAISMAPDIPRYHVRRMNNYLAWDGNTARAYNALEGSDLNNSNIAFAASRLDSIDENYEKAIERISVCKGTRQYHLYKAFYLHLQGREDEAIKEYTIPQQELERLVEVQHDNPFLLRELAISYAGQGKKEEALKVGQRSVDLLPVSKDAVSGADILEDFAWVNVMVGEYETAIEHIKYLLLHPSKLSYEMLHVDPRTKPLRGQDEFSKLFDMNYKVSA